MRFARRSPIAVDLGSHSVKLLQMSQRRGELWIQDAVRVEIEPGARDVAGRRDRLIHALRRALERGEFRGRQAISAIPLARTTMRSLRVAQHEIEDLRGIVSRDAAELFGDDAGTYATQWLSVGERIERGEHRTEVLCCYAPQEEIRSTLHCLSEVGLTVTALDLDACAAMRPFLRPADHGIAVLEIGADSSRVGMARGDDPSLMRVLSVGGEQLLERLRERLHLDRHAMEEVSRAEESDPSRTSRERAIAGAIEPLVAILANGVSECVRYAVSAGNVRHIDHLKVIGGGASIPGLSDALSERLRLTVEVGDPLRAAGSTDGWPAALQAARTCFATAVGLALRGLSA